MSASRVWPLATNDRVRLVAIVLSTARPTAPASCWETLTTPEPNPASALGISDIAICSNGMNDAPAPTPSNRMAKKIWGK